MKGTKVEEGSSGCGCGDGGEGVVRFELTEFTRRVTFGLGEGFGGKASVVRVAVDVVVGEDEEVGLKISSIVVVAFVDVVLRGSDDVVFAAGLEAGLPVDDPPVADKAALLGDGAPPLCSNIDASAVAAEV
jgi:hypothetical protein